MKYYNLRVSYEMDQIVNNRTKRVLKIATIKQAYNTIGCARMRIASNENKAQAAIYNVTILESTLCNL
jgi:hypothetical protein